MIGQLSMFRQNIQLLIGILMFVVLAIILFIGIWTAIKVWVFRARVAKANGEELASKIDLDGSRLPLSSPGICQQCGMAQDAVYHLPHGRRLCRACCRNVGSS